VRSVIGAWRLSRTALPPTQCVHCCRIYPSVRYDRATFAVVAIVVGLSRSVCLTFFVKGGLYASHNLSTFVAIYHLDLDLWHGTLIMVRHITPNKCGCVKESKSHRP
jgi:hypothetical protein